MWSTNKVLGGSQQEILKANDFYHIIISKFAPTLIKQCPICLTNELDLDEDMNAISRKDDSTVICSDCGQAEAMDDLFGTLKEEN
jgi:hypothetical protein